MDFAYTRGIGVSIPGNFIFADFGEWPDGGMGHPGREPQNEIPALEYLRIAHDQCLMPSVWPWPKINETESAY